MNAQDARQTMLENEAFRIVNDPWYRENGSELLEHAEQIMLEANERDHQNFLSEGGYAIANQA